MTEEVTKLWEDYQNGLDYLASTGLSKNIPMYVKQYEGDQWPAATPNTKNMPRPVFNIIKMIVRNKKAGVLSTPVRIVYKGESNDADVRRFNEFASYIQKELGQDELDKRAVHDGAVKGTYVYHYYWDSEAKGRDGKRQGGLRCETIDPLHVIVANPNQIDEQKQKYIIIASREELSSVQAKADSDINVDEIVADDNDDAYKTKEQDGAKLVTVLTRYFRQDGEVYIEKATKNAIVNKPFPLAPDIEGAMKEISSNAPRHDWEKADAPNNTTPDKTGTNELTSDTVKANLYPIVIGSYDFRESCIYGLGEVEGLIPTQKAINFVMAMSIFNVQETAWGKYVALPQALQGQKINNTPGQVLIDHTGTGQGIRKMTEQAMQSYPTVLVDKMTSMLRTMAGSTEVMTGETVGANMSGAAIAALQSQASAPIEEIRDMWWQSKVKQGRVLAQFYKLFYEGYEFNYTGELIPPSANHPTYVNDMQTDIADNEDNMHTGIFYGSDYIGREYDVVVEATGGAKSSMASDIAALDTLFSKGAISLETYVNSYPDDMLSNKHDILDGIQKDRDSQVNQLTEQLTQAQQMNAQLQAQNEQMKGTVDKVTAVIQENRSLKAFIAELYQESVSKINQANETIVNQNATIKDTTDDAMMFAQELQKRESGEDENDYLFQ